MGGRLRAIATRIKAVFGELNVMRAKWCSASNNPAPKNTAEVRKPGINEPVRFSESGPNNSQFNQISQATNGPLL